MTGRGKERSLLQVQSPPDRCLQHHLALARQNRLRGRVEIGDAPGPVQRQEPIADHFQDVLRLLSRLGEGRFRQLAPADVSRGGGRPNHLSLIVVDREDGEGDIDQAPISRLSHSLESLDTCALLHLVEQVANFITPIWRSNDGNRLPDRFLSPVAIQALRGGIPVGNDPV